MRVDKNANATDSCVQESGEQVEVAKKVHAVQAEVLRSSAPPAQHTSMHGEPAKLLSLEEPLKAGALDAQLSEQQKG